MCSWVVTRLTELKKNHLEWDTILDIACGDGRYLKRFHDIGFKVTGIDISEGMIENCINVAEDFGIKQGDFNPIICDGTHIPLPEKSYDVVSGQFGWPSFSND